MIIVVYLTVFVTLVIKSVSQVSTKALIIKE